jgi:hypothetical protein
MNLLEIRQSHLKILHANVSCINCAWYKQKSPCLPASVFCGKLNGLWTGKEHLVGQTQH